MSMMDLINEYMSQSSSVMAAAAYDEHHNGSVHTNSSGHHADSKSSGCSGHSGPGHGDHVDRYADY